jgi:signal transduction histidine kinase
MTVHPAITPAVSDEAERLAALYHYDLIGTDPEPRFDDIAMLAAQTCGCQVALISLIGEQEIWFKSRINHPLATTRRVDSFCQHVLHTRQALVVEDTFLDARFANNALVKQRQPMRFFAGAPIITDTGYVIGVLCVLDYQPRQLSDCQLSTLQVLARQVMSQIEMGESIRQMRQQTAELERLNQSKNRLFSVIAHDLRAAFHGILGFSDVLDTELDDLDQATIRKIASYLNHASQSTFKLLENLLEWAMLENGSMQFRPEVLRLESIIDTVVTGLHLSALQKNIQLEFRVDPRILVQADLNMIRSLIHNLVSNAVKFSLRGGRVWVDQHLEKEQVIIAVHDNGMGMNQNQLDRLFQINLNNSTKGTIGEVGTGLGLLLCKQFVEQHNGKIWVESRPNEGSSFYFSLPVYAAK